MTIDKRNKIYVVMCYVCAIICVVALFVCVILNLNKLPNEGGTNPPTQSSSSAPSGGGDDDVLAGGNDDTEEPTVPETNTDKLLKIIVDSEDVYVAPLSNLIDIDGTLNSIVDEDSISVELENVSTRILSELNAKFGTVHEITSAMLDDDVVYNLFEELQNLLVGSVK